MLDLVFFLGFLVRALSLGRCFDWVPGVLEGLRALSCGPRYVFMALYGLSYDCARI